MPGFRLKTKRSLVFLIAGLAGFGLVGAYVLPRLLVSQAAQYQFTMQHSFYNLTAINAHHYPSASLSTLVQSSGSKVNTDATCKSLWARETKIPHSLNWSHSNVFCWNDADQTGQVGGWYPQGITGSGSAESAESGANKNLLIASWYNAKSPSNLAAPVQTAPGQQSASRITIIDSVTKKYRHIELVKPCTQSPAGFCKLNSHAGGVAWAGSYLYVANGNGPYVFNLNDIRVVNGKYVLPASQKWTLDYTSRNGDWNVDMASISLDRSVSPAQLVTVEYRMDGDYYATKILRWNLQPDNQLGAGPSVATASAFDVPARYLQGVASWQGTYLVNSSTATIGGVKTQALYQIKNQKVAHSWRMPNKIPESIYIDKTHQTVWTLNEGVPPGGVPAGTRFVYSYPLSDVLK